MLNLKTRTIFFKDKLRVYCSKHNLFTYGGNWEYMQIFELAEEFNDRQDLVVFVNIAKWIWEFSTFESLSDYGNYETLAKDIFLNCTTTILE